MRLRNMLRDRLAEPLHLNVIAAAVAAFGSYRAKVDFDLMPRRQYAFGLLEAADIAKRFRQSAVTVIEFGVAAGNGLLNLCDLATRTERATGIKFRVLGFDTGAGLPPPVDYRDFPEDYSANQYPMNFTELSKKLPPFAKLIIGDIRDTVSREIGSLSPRSPLGFISVDVDFYSSAKAALEILKGPSDCYLPVLPIYLDDIKTRVSNPWRGELLAVNEFNDESEMRKIAPYSFLRSRRICKTAAWLDQMYSAHIHDHPLVNHR